MPFGSLTYNSNIPNPPNLPSVDVPNMQINTNSIQSFLERDHIIFSDAFAGAHQQINLQETTLSGTPTLPTLQAGVGFNTLYSTTNSSQIGGNSGELYLVRGGSSTQIQLTGPLSPTPSDTPATNQASNGYTFLAGGLLLQWGLTNSFPSLPSLDVSFPKTFNNLLSLTIGSNTGLGVGRYFAITASNGSGFTISSSAGMSGSGTGVYWMAIGN